MTLMEVLAAVFCLGMGLIMVAGAFPAGAQQTRMTIEQTEASQMAKTVMAEYLGRGNAVQGLSRTQWQGDTSGRPFAAALDFKRWCVWNPTRLPYLENWNESKLDKPGGGDYVARAFLTRVSTCQEAPLFRMTVVVAQFSNEAPDFYDHAIMDSTKVNPGTDSKYPPGLRYVYVSAYSGKTLTTNNRLNTRYPTNLGTYVTNEHYAGSGDWIMDTSTGLCYQIASSNTSAMTITLTESVHGTPVVGRDWFLFRRVMGVFYQLVQ